MPEPEAIVDAEVVAEDVTVAPVQEASTQLARRERRSEVLRPLDPDTLLQSFEEYQGLLQRLLTDDDWQGKPNRTGSFVKKKGWRKIATAFDLDVTVIPGMSKIERAEDGSPIRAEVWIRAIAPSGRTMDGDGYCSVTEPRFAEAKGRQKLENDLRATACVPVRAEILTRRGWKHHAEVTIGEEILAYDCARDAHEWVPVQAIGVYSDAEVVRLANASLDITCTPGHSWAVRTAVGVGRDAVRRLVKTHDLKLRRNHRGRRHGIDHQRIHALHAAGLAPPSIARCVGTSAPTVRRSLARDYTDFEPGDPSRGGIVLAAVAPDGAHPMTPRDAAIIGWLLTDGCIRLDRGYPRAHIDQAKTPYIAELRHLLGDEVTSEAVTQPDPDHRTPNGRPWGIKPCIRFNLSATALRRLGITSRADVLPLLGHLSRAARAAMLDSMLKADGSRRGEAWQFCKIDPVTITAFQTLAALEGRALGLPQRRSKSPRLHVQTLRAHRFADVQSIEIEPAGRADVWCPTTRLGTWVMRLDGQVMVTGNTTRAKNRAISDLIGMGDVSAEEVDATPTVAEQPPYGPAVGEQQLASTRKALGYLLDCEPDANTVGLVLNAIQEKAGNYLPHFPLAMITLVAQTVKDRTTAREETTVAGDGDPGQETAEERQERENAEQIITLAEVGQDV